jgi:hypothetical protein
MELKPLALCTTASLLAVCSAANADGWQIYGSRALGMGGAYTAVARGPIAQYWNPAGMADTFENTSGLEIPVNAHIEATGTVMNDASQLKNLVDQYKSLQSAQQGGGKVNVSQISTMMQSLVTLSDMDKPGQGVVANGAAGLTLKVKKFMIGVNNYADLSGDPYIDLTNISLSGTGGSGVQLQPGTPVNQTDQNSANAIATAITNSGGVTNIMKLICGSGSCNGISTSQGLANALVSYAETQNLSQNQIASAANQIVSNAAQAQAIIAAAIANGGLTKTASAGAGVGTSSAGTWDNNQSSLKIRGGLFTDMAMGYATQVGPEGLYIGGNVKVIRGQMGYTNVQVLSTSDQSNAMSKFLDNSSTSIKPGVDLGALYEMHGASHPRFGIVARNINNPGFNTPVPSQQAGYPAYYNLNPQSRFGFAFNPTHWWTLASDIDVTNNRTILDGYHSRLVSVGSEFNVVNSTWFNIPLRVGYYKNIAESGSDGAITAGTGLDLLAMHFEISGARSTKTTMINGSNIPTDAEAAFTFSVLF